MLTFLQLLVDRTLALSTVKTFYAAILSHHESYGERSVYGIHWLCALSGLFIFVHKFIKMRFQMLNVKRVYIFFLCMATQ